MPAFKILYTRLAEDDLDAIFNYIAIDDREAATKLLKAFDQSICRLAVNPYLGAALPTEDDFIAPSGYRYIVVSPYMVFYRVEDGEVRIGRILHCRRDWLSLMFEKD